MSDRRRRIPIVLVAVFTAAITLVQPAASLLPAAIPNYVAAASNPIVDENLNSGTDAWQIPEPTACVGGLAIPDCSGAPPTTRLAERREIEGYASLTSVPLGGSISFKVSMTVARPYFMQIFRLGWYGGSGGGSLTAPAASLPHNRAPPGGGPPAPTPRPRPAHPI